MEKMEKIPYSDPRNSYDSYHPILESQDQDQRRRNNAKDIVYIGLVLSALLISIFSITLSIFNQMNIGQDYSNGETNGYSPLCLPCDLLAVNPPQFDDHDYEGISREQDKDGYRCCARTGEELENIIQMVYLVPY